MAILLKTRYITAEDFKIYFGIDLANSLNNGSTPNDNPSQLAASFIMRVENRMQAYLQAEYFRNILFIYPKFTNYQKEEYKLALLEQVFFNLRNGDISTDSGYNPEIGVITNNEKLHRINLSENAKDHLMACGLLSRHIGGSNHAGNWWI
jgi:hypothetical protein